MDKGNEERHPNTCETRVQQESAQPSPSQPAASQRACFNVFLIFCVLLVLFFLVPVFLPQPGSSDRVKKAEVKANLHNIQLSVERFAVDHHYNYPQYLIGGEPRYAATLELQNKVNRFTDIRECNVIDEVSDPLLRAGYIDSYPRNPFVRSGVVVHQVQDELTSSEVYGCDPLRNATPEGAQFGTRFGAYNVTMGSVLADPRYRKAAYLNEPDTGATDTPTYADVEYEFWDLWPGNKPKPYLPGQFFYKGMGPVVAFDQSAGATMLPTGIDQYIMGAYGGIRTKGKDILGAEQPIVYFLRADPDDPDAEATQQEVWQMTRSEVSNDMSKREGSPYGIGPNGAGVETFSYGNPNGIRDALILVLTAGEDYLNP